MGRGCWPLSKIWGLLLCWLGSVLLGRCADSTCCQAACGEGHDFSLAMFQGINDCYGRVVLSLPVRRPMTRKQDVRSQTTWVLYTVEASDASSRVSVTHRPCWVRHARVLASVSTGAAASTGAGWTWPTSFIGLLTKAIWTRTSLCFWHEADICSHTCVFIGPGRQGGSSELCHLALVGNFIHSLRLALWCYREEDLIVA